MAQLRLMEPVVLQMEALSAVTGLKGAVALLMVYA